MDRARPEASGFYAEVDVSTRPAPLTQHLRALGWSGITVCAAPDADAAAEVSPRHVAVGVTVGTVSGSAARAGADEEQGLVPQARLDDVLGRYAPGRRIDLLRVSVPGEELEILASASLRRHGPSVVVVEGARADLPRSWAALLTENGYSSISADDGREVFVAPGADALGQWLGHILAEGPAAQLPPGSLAAENVELRARLEAMFARQVPIGEFEKQRTLAEFAGIEAHRARAELASLRASRTFVLATRVKEAASPALSLARRARQALRASSGTAAGTGARLSGSVRLRGRPVSLVEELHLRGHAWSFDGRRHVAAPAWAEPELGEVARLLDDLARTGDPTVAVELRGAFEELQLHSDSHVLWPADKRDALREVETALWATCGPDAGQRHHATLEAGVVVVDARCLQDPQYRSRGIGRHAGNVMRVLRELAPEAVNLVVDPDLPVLDAGLIAPGWSLVPTHAVRSVGGVGALVELSPLTASSQFLLPLLVDPDVWRCAVVYDLIPFHYQSQYLASATDRIRYLARLVLLSRYDRLLPISHASADDLSAIAATTGDVVVTGVSSDIGGDDVAAAPSPTRPGPYVVVAAGGDARKNLPAAVGALAMARDGGAVPHRLVVYGALPQSMVEEIEGLARRCGLRRDDLELLPALSDAELKGVFAGAALAVVPSFAEGYSMPVAEALASRVPVVASDIPAHRELVGAGWWLAPPSDVRALGEAVARALRDPSGLLEHQLATLGDRGDGAAVRRRVAGALDKARRVGTAPLPPKSDGVRSAPGARPRVAVVTPWPPQLSGVADFSSLTLRALAEFADVTVFSTGDAVDDRVAVRPLSAEPYLDASFDRVVTVLGNSPLHIPMLEYLSEFGGACIAHDDRMLDVYARWWGHERTARLLTTPDHTVDADDLPDLLRHIDRIPNRGFATIGKQASPLIVHSQSLARQLADEVGTSARVVPFVPYNLPPMAHIDTATVLDARRRCGMGPGEVHVVTLGIVDPPTKGVDLVIHAIGWLRLWKLDVHLHVLGSLSEELFTQLQQLAWDMGVGDRVHLYGRYSWATHDAFLFGADVGVQLRLSPVLTISGAATDCAAFGLPTLASRTMADEMRLPPYVRRVPDRITGLLLAEEIATMAGDRHASIAEIESQRQEYLQEFSALSYATGLLEALELEGGPVG